MKPKDGKVETRLAHLQTLRGRMLGAVNKVTNQIWEQGQQPDAVRVRWGFYRLDEMKFVEDERKPLPTEEQPFAARMVTPKGLHLRLMLTMLYAAQCAVGPGKQWDAPYPVESTAKQPLSWMSLSASISHYAGPGIQLASEDVNRRRQITAALKSMEAMALVRANTKPGRFTAGFQLLCENGKSTISSAIPYTVPDITEPYVEIPIEFFTRGWVHVLTNSEIAALLMWFDRLKYSGAVVGADEGDPLTITYVTGDVRQGLYGLGRKAYETHQALDAYQLLDVIRPEKRYDSGKWEGYSQGSSDLLCHRVALAPGGFDRDAGEVVEDVLKRRDTGGYWGRPMNSTKKRFDRFRMVSGDE
ncbi:hypothetical protein ACIRPQ_17875 [Streptomyces sp. NPDC101213]|uniref:hypothetical protein n=1 Tax=Streptomyces sp. NPDC101213 TaxID=3366130 RepID=UPI00382499AD